MLVCFRTHQRQRDRCVEDSGWTAQASTVTLCVRGSQRALLNSKLVFSYLNFHFSCTLIHLTHSGIGFTPLVKIVCLKDSVYDF